MEMRKNRRQKFYNSDGVKVHIAKDNSIYPGAVQDLSPTGAAVIIKGDEDLKLGDEMDVIFYRGEYEFSYRAKIISESEYQNPRHEGFGRRLGIVPVDSETFKIKSVPVMPRKQRYQVNQFLPPTITATHPLIFNEVMYFRVSELGANGLTAHTSLRNVGLSKGMSLQLFLKLPTSPSEIPVSMEITNIKQVDDHFRVGFKLREASMLFNEDVSQYILATVPGASPASLRAQGFGVLRTGPSISVSYSGGAKDVEEITNLRHTSYSAGNALLKQTPIDDFWDVYDLYSRQLVIRSDGRIIGACRVIFPNNTASRIEAVNKYKFPIEAELSGISFIEVSRLCVHPEYQKTDLYYKLLEFCLRIARDTENRYMLAILLPDRVALFEKLGFKVIGTPIDYPEHRVTLFPMLLDCHLYASDTAIEKAIEQRQQSILKNLGDKK